MSAITIDGDLIHYEKLGRGRPVILIHGWVGSWRYWIPLMQKLHTSFSVYTLDLIGFGDSSKNKKKYSVESQVKMLETFLKNMGIPKAAIIGHSYGAMVATQFTLRNPDKVARLMLSSMPLYDPGDLDTRIPAGTRQMLTNNDTRHSLAPNLKDFEQAIPSPTDKTVANTELYQDPTIASGSKPKTNSGIYTPFHEQPTIQRPDTENIDRDALRRAAAERDRKKNQANPLLNDFRGTTTLNLLEKCYRKSEPEYEKLKVDVEKADDAVLAKSAEDYEAGNMLDDLRRITAPIVA
ncbi:MAG: alpha/beta hydrolase, partial [Chloroflexota bacterium]